MQAIIQPYVNETLQAVVGIAVILLMGVLANVRKKAQAWYDSHTNVKQRETLHIIGQEAFAFAQTAYKDLDGPQRMQQGISYADGKLAALGLTFTVEEIRASIEKAYLEYKAKTTQPATPDPVTVQVPVEKPLAPEVQQLIEAAKAVAAGQETAEAQVGGGGGVAVGVPQTPAG